MQKKHNTPPLVITDLNDEATAEEILAEMVFLDEIEQWLFDLQTKEGPR